VSTYVRARASASGRSKSGSAVAVLIPCLDTYDIQGRTGAPYATCLNVDMIPSNIGATLPALERHEASNESLLLRG
jgi:hypothetical protein